VKGQRIGCGGPNPLADERPSHHEDLCEQCFVTDPSC
jgi:hypothetical protein